MALLTKGQAPQVAYTFKTVPADELGDGVEILVRGLNVAAREFIEGLMIRFKNGEKNLNWRAHLAIAGMVDPDRRLEPDGFLYQWTEKDLQIIGNWPSQLVERLCDAIMELSGMSVSAKAEVKAEMGKAKKSVSSSD